MRIVNSLKKHSIDDFDALDLGEAIGERDGIGMVDPGETLQSRLAEQAHMDRERQRAQAGIGADVARRLLAADMLLPRRQREHEAAPALRVDRLAGETPRHLPRIFQVGGEEADIGAAEIQRIADRLALADDDVGAHFARRAQSAERDSLGEDGDQQRALGLSGRLDRREIAQIAEKIRALDDDATRIRRRSPQPMSSLAVMSGGRRTISSPAMPASVAATSAYCG